MVLRIDDMSVLRLRGGSNVQCPYGLSVPQVTTQCCPAYSVCHPVPNNCCNSPPVIILTMPPPPGNGPGHSTPSTPSEGLVTPLQAVAPHRPKVKKRRSRARLQEVKKNLFPPRRFTLPPIHLGEGPVKGGSKKSSDDPANAVISVEVVPTQKPDAQVQYKMYVQPGPIISDSPFTQPGFQSSPYSQRRVPPRVPTPGQAGVRPAIGPPGAAPPKAESFKSLQQSSISTQGQPSGVQPPQRQSPRSVQPQQRRSPSPAVARSQRQEQQNRVKPRIGALKLNTTELPSNLSGLEKRLHIEPFLASRIPGDLVVPPIEHIDENRLNESDRNRLAVAKDLKQGIDQKKAKANEHYHRAKENEAQVKALRENPFWSADEAEKERMKKLLTSFFQNRRNYLSGYVNALKDAKKYHDVLGVSCSITE